MKRTEKTVNKRRFIIEEFRNSSELIEITNNREAHDWGNARDRKDNDWCGATFDEAQKMLMYGWDQKVDVIKKGIKKLEKQGTIKKMTFKNDVVGFTPVVPNAILGLPQSMINGHVVAKKSKVIKVLVDLGATAGNSSDDMIEYGITVLQKLYSLEKQGFRVRIEFLRSFNGREREPYTYAIKYLLKSENQPFDIKRMCFPLIHTAMFRRICFDWYERLPNAIELSGYGTTINKCGDTKNIKDVLCNDKNTYMIMYGDDLDETFKNIK